LEHYQRVREQFEEPEEKEKTALELVETPMHIRMQQLVLDPKETGNTTVYNYDGDEEGGKELKGKGKEKEGEKDEETGGIVWEDTAKEDEEELYGE